MVENIAFSIFLVFYTFLLQSNDANKALKMAIEETKKIYKNPYYWGGFIVLN